MAETACGNCLMEMFGGNVWWELFGKLFVGDVWWELLGELFVETV